MTQEECVTVKQRPPVNLPDDDQGEPSRKERVLHTRVPAVLESELKRLAESLRVPVSNVVRAILEDAVDAADAVSRRVEGDIRGWAEKLAAERSRLRSGVQEGGQPVPSASPSADALSSVLGFQSLMLAQNAKCAVCGRELVRGAEAYLGIRESGVAGPRVVLGKECLPGP
ncbi:MAG: hypothetical protein IPK60_02415 [Sandaracinaceae bacterium]|nr:hypothetical protein [Sandaracinaceae bacterium]